jgi:predicted NBD/HSP70 family sugar kinase
MHGPSSRGHLGKVLKLSDASMSRLARTLVDGGMVVEDAEPEQGIGRPRQILSAAPGARHVVGVKLTGEVAYAVATDLLGTVLSTAEAPLPAPDGGGVVPLGPTIKAVARLVRKLGKRLPSLDGVGVSLGGPVADHSTVLEATFLGWYDVQLAGLLVAELGLPVAVSNDVAALAREQLWFGAGRTHSTFAVLTVGAGIGVGIVREGHVVDQLIDNGHLLAHSPIDSSGPACSLGHRGCVAAYLNREDVLARASSRLRRPVNFADLVAGRERGNAIMSGFVDDASRALGHLVATAAGALQTDRIVLAGEDVAALTGEDSAMQQVMADRLRPGPRESQHCTLDVTTTPLAFTDWARGAAVVAIQDVLGAVNRNGRSS